MPKLHAGQRAMAVHRLGHQRMGADIVVVPEPGKGNGESSELGWMEHAPVQTTPQPPWAFVSRNAARTRGSALVMPLAWGTW